jgi:RNA polymerase sigma-70 factor (ECF subfamily)
MRIEQAEDRLVERAQDGDPVAFTALYDDLAPRVLRFLSHQVANPDLAEELMQRTFVKVIEALDRFQVRGAIPFRAWVFRLARNVAIDDHRTTHPALDVDAVAEPISPEPTPDEILDRDIQREELLAAIDRLPQDQHDVIVYRFFADLSPAEAAPLLHRSEGAVRVLQHRALKRLRGFLAGSVRLATAGAEA